jgi:hypothetical protein
MRKHRIPFLAGILVVLAATTLVTPPAFAGVKGDYTFGIDGTFPLGPMTINKDHTFSDVSGGGVTDTGTWTKLQKAITLTITASSYQLDVGCVLSGTVVAHGINTPSSPGLYTCGAFTGTWYAVKSGGSTKANGNLAAPSHGFAG